MNAVPLVRNFCSYKKPLRSANSLVFPQSFRADFEDIRVPRTQAFTPLQRPPFRLQSRQQSEWPYIYRSKSSATMAPNLDSFFKEVDSQAEYFIDRLRKAVAIPSVSADEARRPDVVKVRMILTFCLLRAMSCSAICTPALRGSPRATH